MAEAQAQLTILFRHQYDTVCNVRLLILSLAVPVSVAAIPRLQACHTAVQQSGCQPGMWPGATVLPDHPVCAHHGGQPKHECL